MTPKAKAAAAALTLGSAAILGALQLWEGQRLTVYADKLAGGLPTYCSGRTQPPRPVGSTLTQAECDAIDRQTVTEYGRAILECIPAERMDQNSFDAMTLFAVNVGKTAACNSRAAILMRDGQRENACRALAYGPDGRPVWSYAKGVYVPGLHNRRRYESNWCFKLAAAA